MYDRLSQWKHFNEQMERHIEQYTKPQYGSSEGTEQVDSFTVADCWREMQRYYNRRNVAVRGSKEQLRDLIKVAHYAQLAYDKLVEELRTIDVYDTPNDTPNHDPRNKAAKVSSLPPTLSPTTPTPCCGTLSQRYEPEEDDGSTD